MSALTAHRAGFSWPVVGIVVLGLVTGLVALAALRGPGGTPGVAPQPTGSALVDPPQVTSEPSIRPADRRVPDVEPLLSMVDATTAYRGTPGTCLGGASAARTLDGGRTWSDVELPAGALMSLSASTGVVAQIVAADASCVAAAWTTNSAGREWLGPNPTVGLWHRLAETPRKIATPSRTVLNPCPDRAVAVVEIEALTETAAALLCQDGQVVRSIDGGSGWTNASLVAGAVALAWNSPELGWLLDTGGDLCPGLQALRSVDGGVTWQEGGCVGTSQQAASSGRPALDFADPQNGMALVGTETFVTADGGVTWQAA